MAFMPLIMSLPRQIFNFPHNTNATDNKQKPNFKNPKSEQK